MKDELCVQLALYLIENKSTIRKTALNFNLSKSAVHNQLSKNLKKVNLCLYTKVQEIFEINKQEKHIRGGIATQNKFKNIKIKQ